MSNKRPIATLFVLGGVIFFLIIIGSASGLSFFGSFSRVLFNPVASIIHRLAETIRPDSLSQISSDDVKSKLDQIEKDNSRLLAENARLLTLEDENKHLRDYLSFTQEKKLSLQMAEVISRGLAEDSWHNRRTITLNQGSDQGIKVGMPIVSSEGVLLGKITNLKSNISEACLLYSSDCRIAVGLAGQGKTIGIARGDLGLNVVIELIAQTQDINEQQMIVTSGLEEGMPAGLFIGKVNKVIKQNNELWQSAIIEPAANFDDLRFVAILK